jgi:glycosyltransferase involved in cell wall biosynthesis
MEKFNKNIMKKSLINSNKVVFISNFMNEHQLHFSNALYSILGTNYVFIETDRLSLERIKMQFKEVRKESKARIINILDNNEEKLKAISLIDNADFVIFGSGPIQLIENRLKLKKYIFYYTERLFRNGRYRILNPFFFYHIWKYYLKYFNRNLFLLSVGKYSHLDFKFLKLFKGKSFKWGYFPKFILFRKKEKENIKNEKFILKILWVGRLIWWKHPEHALHLANYLLSRNISFNLQIIGEGPEKDKLVSYIFKNNLSAYVQIKDFMPQDKIRKEMIKSNIYLMSSDQNEGWGVVVNEAMNSKCVVIGSNLVGSISYLIEDGINGLVYDYKSLKTLFSSVEKIIENPSLIHVLSEKAYLTIKNQWNPLSAAKNLVCLMNSIRAENLNKLDLKGPVEFIKD